MQRKEKGVLCPGHVIVIHAHLIFEVLSRLCKADQDIACFKGLEALLRLHRCKRSKHGSSRLVLRLQKHLLNLHGQVLEDDVTSLAYHVNQRLPRRLQFLRLRFLLSYGCEGEDGKHEETQASLAHGALPFYATYRRI